MARGWLDLFRSLGEAFVEVMGAEAAALQGDLGRTGRRYVVVLALFSFAVFAIFWAIGAAAFAFYKILALWIEPWIAAAIVWGLWVVMGMCVWIVAQRRLRAIESPTATLQRHVEEHRVWMQSNLLGHTPDLAASSSSLDEAAEVEEV